MEIVRESGYFGPLDIEGDQFWWGGFGDPDPHPGADDPIDCAVIYEGDLIFGGRFDIVADIVAHCIVRWDGQAWSALGEGLSGCPRDMIVHAGQLIVGGQLDAAGGAPIANLAVYDGDLIAAGNFTNAGGQPCNRISRWDGELWHPLGSGLDYWA